MSVAHITIYRDELIPDEAFMQYVAIPNSEISEDGNSVTFYVVSREVAESLT